MTGRPLRIALTGGLATGKSFCLAAFARLGAPVIDADTLARAAVEPGTPGLALVVRRFGTGVLAADGRLSRDALSRLVFKDADARRDLEAIVHPEVYAGIRRWFDELTGAPAGVAEIPLLYETDHAGDFDRVVVAACSRDEQKRRAMARDGLERVGSRASARRAASRSTSSASEPTTSWTRAGHWRRQSGRCARFGKSTWVRQLNYVKT